MARQLLRKEKSPAHVLPSSSDDLALPPDDWTSFIASLSQQPSLTSSGGIMFGYESHVGDPVKNPYYIAWVAAKVCAGIVKSWKLDDSDAEKMLAVDSQTWMRIKNGKWKGLLDHEVLVRISAIIGIYKALHSCFSDDLADRWIKRPNTGRIFSGRKPVDVMIEEGLPVMLETRHYLAR